MNNTLYLIDTMGLVFRAYHAMMRMGFQSPSGEPTGAVFGVSNILATLLERESPMYIAAVFDTKEPTFRHQRYDLYKANRQAFPEELVPQLARIKQVIDLAGIRRIEMPGFEADDIIGTLATYAGKAQMDAICITSDKDYFQLVNDYVKVYRPSKGSSSDYDVFDAEKVREVFGVYPQQVIDVLALQGDSSDNVPGVKGIGEKTALSLITEYGSLDNVYANVDSITKKAVKANLTDHKDMAYLSKELVTIHTDVPLGLSLDDCRRSEQSSQELDGLFAELGMASLRERWRKQKNFSVAAALQKSDTEQPAAIPIAEQPKPPVLTVETRPHSYYTVLHNDDMQRLIDELSHCTQLCVDLETTSLNTMQCDIVGIALSTKENTGWYIPVSDRVEEHNTDAQHSLFEVQESAAEYSSDYMSVHTVLQRLRPFLENPDVPKIGQNLKFDALILRRYDVVISPVGFDTMLASYLLDADKPHNMDALALRWMNYSPISITTLIGEKKNGSMKDAPLEKVAEYAAEDADVTITLRNILYTELEKNNLLTLAETIEFPVSEVLTQMEYNGIKITTEALSEISAMIKTEVERLRKDIFLISEQEFNIDSPKQVGEILFDKLKIPGGKKTKTGYSTDVSVLSELAADYPVAGMILEHRQLQKLQSTYVEALPKMVNPQTGRIHTTYNQTIAGTGRLSSVEPNLQNIPIRTALGRSIRRAFIPSDTNNAVLLSCDYSQIELRIMAYISRDETLMHAFQHGLDIHSATAAKLFSVPLSEVSSSQRRIAKTVNFGIMYGQGSFGLAQQLSISRKEAKTIIDQYFTNYPRIREYFDTTLESVRSKGYAETLCGRRRYFSNINSNNATIRQSTERAAINMPIQGTAADMMKIAMIQVHKRMKQEKVRSLMLLQIHDELVFDVPNDEIELMKTLVVETMQNALALGDVPVLVEAGIGKNWDEAH